MMADDGEVDDYMSDEFLASLQAAEQKQHQAPGKARAKRWSEQGLPGRATGGGGSAKAGTNRMVSRPQLEQQLRDEALQRPIASNNVGFKLLSKMGYKPGSTLGALEQPASSIPSSTTPPSSIASSSTSSVTASESSSTHDGGDDRPGLGSSSRVALLEPLPLLVKRGREGIGIEEQARREADERLSKRARLADDFAARQREQFQLKKLEGQLRAVWRTCEQLDRALDDTGAIPSASPLAELIEAALKLVQQQQQQQQAAQEDGDGDERAAENRSDANDEQEIEASAIEPHKLSALVLESLDSVREALARWLHTQAQAQAQARAVRIACQHCRSPRVLLRPLAKLAAKTHTLERLLHHLRTRHLFCFYCGATYKDASELEQQCPGLSEEAHE